LPKIIRFIGKTASAHSIFIDTSAWIALFSRRDQHHEEADRAFNAIVASKKRILTTNLIIAEIHRLLLQRAGIQAAAAALQKIETSSLVDVTFPDHSSHQSAKDWLDRLQAHPISYADAVSFSVMKMTGCREALSYDRPFQIAGFKVGLDTSN
jgi:uncharacterized protein